VQVNWPANYHSSVLTNAKVDQFINDAQRRICRLYNYTWMKQEVEQDTTDEEPKYLLPTAGDSDWAEVESGTVFKWKSEVSFELINYDNIRIPLTKIHKVSAEGRRKFRDLDSKGIPSDYAVDQSYIWLYYKPYHADNGAQAFTMSLEFYGYLADLSANSDHNHLTDNYSEALEYGATALGFRYGMDFEQAEYWERKAIEVIAEMRNEDAIEEFGTIEEGMRPADGQEIGI